MTERPKEFIVPAWEAPLRPDRFVKSEFVEIDGVVHDTDLQRMKTRRRDRAILEFTLKRILHIPDELLVRKEWHDYVAYRYWLWKRSDDPAYRIPL
ncbi:MAG TPA: hypothetical protein VJR06_09585 [Nitrososphaerales archaeon]|nr:hypothetical protein [Nitrososphaerales archaeon]